MGEYRFVNYDIAFENDVEKGIHSISFVMDVLKKNVKIETLELKSYIKNGKEIKEEVETSIEELKDLFELKKRVEEYQTYKEYYKASFLERCQASYELTSFLEKNEPLLHLHVEKQNEDSLLFSFSIDKYSEKWFTALFTRFQPNGVKIDVREREDKSPITALLQPHLVDVVKNQILKRSTQRVKLISWGYRYEN
mgnify:CR=1 FL=1